MTTRILASLTALLIAILAFAPLASCSKQRQDQRRPVPSVLRDREVDDGEHIPVPLDDMREVMTRRLALLGAYRPRFVR